MKAAVEFAKYGVATVYQAAGNQGLIDVPLIQIVPGSRAAGPARTVRCGQGDNLMVHAAMASVVDGEVLVITTSKTGPVALVGELLASQAAAHGVAAILVDGAVRDTTDLSALGLPIWARWIRVTQATKEAVGAINVPVTVGGTEIAPGDIVVLDADGAVAVSAALSGSVLRAAKDLAILEDERRRQYQAGALSLDVMGLREKLDSEVME